MDLKSKVKQNKFTVGIIGLGYVGLPLALEFANKGIKVIGFDLDESKVKKINSEKQSYIKHIPSDKIKSAVNKNTLIATSDFSKLPEADAIIICVPTPLNVNREPDMSYVINTAEVIGKYIRKGQFVSLESTTYPGTTDEILLKIFESKGLKAGKDFYLCFSPEREDPNNEKYSTSTIPKVLGGVTKQCTEIGKLIYEKVIVKVVPVSSTKAAESTKLLENIFRSINIALVNELKVVFDRMGIDVWEVIEAASTKPFGYTPFYPGPGLGGHCIPIDPFYLTWKAREYEISTKFIELAGEINTSMPEYVVNKVYHALNENKKCLKDSKILLLGLAYKKDIDDLRESPSLKLIELLQDEGAVVDYSDDYVNTIPRLRKYEFSKKSVKLTKKNISKYDLVLLSTDHSYFDYKFIFENAKIIVDTRNAFKNFLGKKLYKA
ncbi:MAG: UDP-N-acetyl-D-glucosamine 6-dehydrogenase [Ignavibacteria bacterium]|nr:UDP-N-acetyl-D-glucosamine 6-dehydrogenase [Ignavibacteria bacterium]